MKNKITALAILMAFGTLTHVRAQQMGQDSSTIGVVIQYFGNPYAQQLPTQRITNAQSVTVDRPIQQLNVGTASINSACYAGDPYQPSQYDYATWSNTCGSRFCRSRGYVAGFISEYTGGNKNNPATNNSGGAVVNCF